MAYINQNYTGDFQITFKKDSKLHDNVFSAIKKVGHRGYLSAKTAFLVDIGHKMVTSCCHGNMKSSACGLKSLFYIRGNNGLCKKLVFSRFKLIK
jgi:hypothetical protein